MIDQREAGEATYVTIAEWEGPRCIIEGLQAGFTDLPGSARLTLAIAGSLSQHIYVRAQFKDRFTPPALINLIAAKTNLRRDAYALGKSMAALCRLMAQNPTACSLSVN